MIKHISTTSKHLWLSSGNFPYIDNSRPSAGLVRYNNSDLEVFDGSSWVLLNGTATLNLAPELDNIFDWLKEKYQEEKKLDELCKQHPALDKARENFELIKKLVASEQIND